jgi:hypothetical protein
MSEIADASPRRGKRRAPPTLTQARNPGNLLLKRDDQNGNLKLQHTGSIVSASFWLEDFFTPAHIKLPYPKTPSDDARVECHLWRAMPPRSLPIPYGVFMPPLRRQD